MTKNQMVLFALVGMWAYPLANLISWLFGDDVFNSTRFYINAVLILYGGLLILRFVKIYKRELFATVVAGTLITMLQATLASMHLLVLSPEQEFCTFGVFFSFFLMLCQTEWEHEVTTEMPRFYQWPKDLFFDLGHDGEIAYQLTRHWLWQIVIGAVSILIVLGVFDVSGIVPLTKEMAMVATFLVDAIFLLTWWEAGEGAVSNSLFGGSFALGGVTVLLFLGLPIGGWLLIGLVVVVAIVYLLILLSYWEMEPGRWDIFWYR